MGWKFQGPDRPPAAFEPTPPPEGEAVPVSVDAGDTSYRTGQWRWGTQFQPAAEPTVMDIVKRGAKEALGQGVGTWAAARSIGPYGRHVTAATLPIVAAGGAIGSLGAKIFDEELIGNRLPGERPGPDIGDAYALAGGALVTPLRSATTGAVSKLVKDKPRKWRSYSESMD